MGEGLKRAKAAAEATAIVHPVVRTWRAFAAGHPELFDGSASGTYLRNRLERAYVEGWGACERTVRASMEPK